MIDLVAWPCLAVLLVSVSLCLIRLARGPSAADQLMAYGTISSMSMAIFIVLGMAEDPVFLEALVPLALVSFVAVLLIARFLEGEVE